MELRQLEYFVAVVEEANFTRAAARVHVAQPGVSAQIRRLERELGQPLLDRSGRTVKVTEAGAAVLPYARAALAAVSGARLAVEELTGLLRGHVTIGTVTTISSEDVDLPGLLARFHAAHPNVEITQSVASSDQLIEGLHTGRFDLALLGLGSSTPPPGLTTHIITDEPLVAVVSRTDPLAAKTTIALRALAERTLISLPPGAGLRACLDEACTNAGIRPRISFETGDPRVATQLAAKGLGVAVVPRTVAGIDQDHLHTLTISGPELRGRLAIAWLANGPSSPAARVLIRRACAVPAAASAEHRPAGTVERVPSRRRASTPATPTS
jgi:DNA-binding transcriptional LysR family regulator